MSRPKTPRLLVNTVTLEAAGAPDANGNVTYGTAQTLTRVRVTRASLTPNDILGDAKNDKLVLTYDCKTSRPLAVTFKVKDRVTFRGSKFLVREVDDPSDDFGNVLFYRVRLVTNGR